ncbi:MAG: electron transfer flavoprotein subunit alpha/FixB family protein [Myxococcota bacterium]|nr:electron transfer flavoprotein subunit alpha/FixB family protein [Myxococcota bacterium]
MSNGILVVCEHENGTPKKTAYELLSKARELSASLGGDVSALLIGASTTEMLGEYGAATVYTVEGADFDAGGPGAWVSAMSAAIAAANPAVVLGSTSDRTRAAFPRLAARIGAGMASDCTELFVDGGAIVARRPMYAGKASAEVRFSSDVALVTARPNSFPGATASGSAVGSTPLDAQLSDLDAAVKIVGLEEPKSAVVDLAEASRIVSGGRPVDSAENFDALIRPLAAAMGATAGASRAAVDSGFAPHSEQVGQTGKVVNPSLYIACAISGAIQHLAGMRTSRVIVAINKNPDAPIFEHATYGIVGDIFEVVPALADEARKQGISA